MRLIDANELRRWLNGYLETDNISPTYIRALIDSQQTVEAIPIDKPFLKMKYKGYTVYKTEWLKEHIEMEYRVIKGISESKAEAIPIGWIEKKIAELYEALKPCITENGEIVPATADDLLKYYPFSVLLDAYEKVLENWRKENAID